MAVRTAILILLLFFAVAAAEDGVDFVCPMDRDVHAAAPGKCPRCGMKLVANLPDAVEYPLRLTVSPAAFQAGDDVTLTFEVLDPKTGKRVRDFEVVHEKLFHLFVVSADLQHFAHDHPELQPDGRFTFRYHVPRSGEFRVLCDFYPKGGTPQLIVRTIFAAGRTDDAHLQPDLAAKKTANMTVALRTDPEKPIAGSKTMMFFDLSPSDHLEPYLGAWGHMLAASADAIDLIHNHPAYGQPGSSIQFNLIFPRPGIYRVWVQFQRDGKVNTAAFNVPVAELQ